MPAPAALEPLGRPQKGKATTAAPASLFDITSPVIAPLTTSPDSFCSPVWGSGRKVSDGGAVRAVHEPQECRPVSETGKDEVFEADFPNRVASPGCHGRGAASCYREWALLDSNQ